MLAAARQFHDFAQVFARRARRDDQAGFFDARQVMVVRFIAVAMALGHRVAVDFGGQCARLDRAGLRAQAHGAAQIRVGVALLDLAVMVLPFVDQRHYRLLGGVVFYRSSWPCSSRRRRARIRSMPPACQGRCRDTESCFRAQSGPPRSCLQRRACRNRPAPGSHRTWPARRRRRLDVFGIDVLDIHPAFGMEPALAQRFGQRLVARSGRRTCRPCRS